MNVLVTGGAGFIGSHLVESFLSAGDEVFVLDNYETSRRDVLSEQAGLAIADGSIADPSIVREAFERSNPDVVVHCAASYKDPDNWREDVHTNIFGAVNIVGCARDAKVSRIIYLQTALCYGNHPHPIPVPPDHMYWPESSYAASKAAAEQYLNLSGVDTLCFRLANVYGPRNLSGPVPTFFKRLTEQKACFATKTKRDFVFVGDMIEVLEKASKGVGDPGYYNIASGGDYWISAVYRAVVDALGIDGEFEERDPLSDDAPSILLDADKTKATYDWDVKTGLDEGIRLAVEWYKIHGVEDTYTHLKLKD